MGELIIDRRAVTFRHHVLQVVLPAMLLPFFASILYYILLAGTVTATVIYAGTKVLTVVWPVAANRVLGGPAILSTRFWRTMRHRAAVPMGVMTGLVLGALIVGAYLFTPGGTYVGQFTEQIRFKVTEMGIGTPVRYVVFCGFLAVVHSLIEEFFWRWFVYGYLRRVLVPGVALVLASLAFAAHHYVVLGCYFPLPAAVMLGSCVGLGGALWCRMYDRQRTLAGCWVSHALVDAGIFVVGYRVLFM